MGFDDVGVVLADGTAEGFEEHDEKEHADAGSGEGAGGFVVPGAGDEAWSCAGQLGILK